MSCCCKGIMYGMLWHGLASDTTMFEIGSTCLEWLGLVSFVCGRSFLLMEPIKRNRFGIYHLVSERNQTSNKNRGTEKWFCHME
mmetsp:Transcript_7602/g.15636  ORF Transcript_7602/g.15636 Transcript_7602/m.15636 type:complete len:84 (+) Transcript_7602:111-362(+)